MASTRELWMIFKARDEASRVVSSFSKNVRAAALATKAAQKTAEAGAIRQQAQMLKSTGTNAQQIRAINQNVVALEKQARAQTKAAATAREQRAKMMSVIGSEVKGNNLRAANLERQARALTLASNTFDEHRESIVRVTGATGDNVKAIDAQIAQLRKRAATLSSEAAVHRSASASMIAQVEKESVGLEGSIRSYERRAAAIRAQASILRNQAAQQRINLDGQVRALTDQAAALDREANGLRQSAHAAREHDHKLKALTNTLGKVSAASIAAGFALASIGVGGLVGLKDAIDTAVAYEQQVRLTATQVDGFGANLKELGDIGRRVANEIAVPFESIQPALFDIFSSMEVGTKDAEKLLHSFAKAAVAGQTDIQNVSRATIGVLNAFRRPAKDVNKILDIQFQLIQEGVGTYEEWTQRIGNVTPSAVRAGQSIETMFAALATATRLGLSSARSATAVSRAFDALSHPKAVQTLKEMGVAVTDANGNFRPFVAVMEDFRDKLQKLPAKGQLGKIEAILDVFKGAGGTIEARKFLQGILLTKGGLETLKTVFDETSNSAGSLDNAYGIMADSTASKSELLRNKWQLLKEAIGEALLPAFDKLLDKGQQVLDWFNKLPASTKKTIGMVLLLASAITILTGSLFLIIGAFAIFATAIAGMTAGMWLAIAVFLAIGLIIAGFTAAVILAYNKSKNFRDLVNEVKGAFSDLWDVVVETAKEVKASFDEHMKPALERLWETIDTKVIPIIKDLVAQFRDEIIPKVKEAGRIISDFYDKYLKEMADFIDETVIPALEELSDWWKKNKDEIGPLIYLVGQLVKWLLILIGVVVGVLIVVFVGPLMLCIALVIGAFMLLVEVWKLVKWAALKLWEGVMWVWDQITGRGDKHKKWSKKTMGEIGSDYDGVGKRANDMKNAIVKGFNESLDYIKGFGTKAAAALASLGGEFRRAGIEAIQGFIGGMGSMMGPSTGMGASIAAAAAQAARDALKSKSPSKVFRDIGQDTIRGMILGIKGSRKQLSDAMFRVQRDVIRSIQGAKISSKAKSAMQRSWTARLARDTKALLALEYQRTALGQRLTAAQTQLNDQLKERNELAQKITETLAKNADLTTLSEKEQKTTAGMAVGLQKRVDAMKQFTTQLRELASRGFDRTTIAQLAEAGVDSAGKMVGKLASATDGELQEISRLQNEIRKMAQDSGTQVAGDLYNAGIAAAQGLIKGLQTQMGAITKQMEKIANALVVAIKKTLGIHSPSKVFAEIGKNTALGYGIGFRKKMSDQVSGMQSLMTTYPQRVNAGLFDSQAQTTPGSESRGKMFDINIHTQEINPKKHAADLGWELEGRLG